MEKPNKQGFSVFFFEMEKNNRTFSPVKHQQKHHNGFLGDFPLGPAGRVSWHGVVDTGSTKSKEAKFMATKRTKRTPLMMLN